MTDPRRVLGASGEDAVAAYPAQRPVDPDEIAETIAFLASDVASGINGQAVTIALGGVW